MEKNVKNGDEVIIERELKDYGGCEGVVVNDCVGNNPYYVLVDVSHHPMRKRLIRCHISEVRRKNPFDKFKKL